jgi:hypothetical protein
MMHATGGNFEGGVAESEQKFKELLIYISEQSEGDSSYGATKANKILFFADFLAYLYLGRSITGWSYERMNHGPVPVDIYSTRNEMELEDSLLVYDRDYHGNRQTRYVARRQPDLSMFSAEEISLVDRLLRENWGKSARDISDESHRFAGWAFAHDREIIPYEVALVNFREPTPAEIEYGQSLIPLVEMGVYQ